MIRSTPPAIRYSTSLIGIIATGMIAAVASGALAPRSARADWEANVVVHMPKKDTPIEAYARVKKGMFRMEMTKPHPMATIMDTTQKKAWVIMTQAKMYMEMDLAALGHQSMACITEGADIAGCLKRNGFKPTGSEKMNGYPCHIYEGEVAVGKQMRKTKLWRPDTLPEIPMVRSMQLDPVSKDWVTTDITGIKIAPQAAAYFKVPDGYRALPKAFPGAQQPTQPPAPPKH